jgi:hypothetical protein
MEAIFWDCQGSGILKSDEAQGWITAKPLAGFHLAFLNGHVNITIDTRRIP